MVDGDGGGDTMMVIMLLLCGDLLTSFLNQINKIKDDVTTTTTQ